MSEGRVVSLHGKEILEPGTRNPACVDIGAKFLELASSGEIKEMVAVGVHHDGTITIKTAIDDPTFRLIGALQYLATYYSRQMDPE